MGGSPLRPVAIAPVLALVLSMGLSGGTRAQDLACRSGKPQQVAELMFGRKIGGRVGVSEAAWRRFVDREITPRFPDGLTVLDARGQWRDTQTARIVREPSKLVQIVLPGKDEDEKHLSEVAEAYKKAFRQQSVGIVLRAACVSF